MITKQGNDYGTGIPRHEAELFARALWPDLKAYFESEQGQREFAAWKSEQQEQNHKPT